MLFLFFVSLLKFSDYRLSVNFMLDIVELLGSYRGDEMWILSLRNLVCGGKSRILMIEEFGKVF